ncbi:hypothetical protein ACFLTR_03065 [Chloroflexota bacterium]
MNLSNWLKEWAGVLTLFLTFFLTILIPILIYCLQKKFRIKQKQREDIELIMDWVTKILALQNEYLVAEALLELNLLEMDKKCNELVRKYFEISLLAKDLNKSIYDKAKCLNEEFTRFNRQVRSECLRNKIEYKEVPYSKEIQLAAQDLLQESIEFRKEL